jgi:hypothetical protein
MRARLLVPLALLAIVAFPAGARAATIGLSDQDPGAFADARLRGLHLRYARVVVPWDAASTAPDRVQAWLSAVAAAGLAPHARRARRAELLVVAGDRLRRRRRRARLGLVHPLDRALPCGDELAAAALGPA